MTKAEELAQKWCGPCTCHEAYTSRKLTDPSCVFHNDYDGIVSLLQEYGALVRKRDAELCRELPLTEEGAEYHVEEAIHCNCAAVIEQEKLP